MVAPIDKVRDALGSLHLRINNDQGHDFYSQCPAHDDRIPSLHVSEGIDGRVLLHCKTGCPNEKVIEALGMRMAELFSDTSRSFHRKGATRSVPRLTLSALHARVYRLLYGLDRKGQTYAVSVTFDCPVCGAPGAWARGDATHLALDCPEGCPADAMIFQLEREE